MKSLSNLYPHTSSVDLKAWDMAELDIDVTESIQEIDREQILALFENADKESANKQGNNSHPALHRAGVNLVLNAWQPEEIDLLAALPDENGWLFSEKPGDASESPEEEIRQEEAIPEKENGINLKQAHVQAEAILQKAQAEAEQVLFQARTAIEQERKNGYEQGLRDARTEMQESLKAVASIVDETQNWQTEFMAQGEQAIIEILKEIAQTMFGEGVQLDPEALQINLNRIMENAQRLGDLNIFLHPRDADLLDPSWKEYQHLISGNKVRVIPSEKITPGGCIIKGITGMVDGRVETQLAAILNTFDEMREVAQ